MTWLVPLPVIIPLLGAALTLLLRRHPNMQRTVSLLVLSATLAVSIALLALTVSGGRLPAPLDAEVDITRGVIAKVAGRTDDAVRLMHDGVAALAANQSFSTGEAALTSGISMATNTSIMSSPGVRSFLGTRNPP